MKTLGILTAVSFVALASPAFAGEQSAQGSANLAAGSVVAGSKIASAAVAVPLMGVGVVGEAAGETGKALWNYSNGPLPITNDAVVTGR